jgi:hypothetical protein
MAWKRRLAALIVMVGALTGASVVLPAVASAAAVADDATGGTPNYTVPAGPAVPPGGETGGGTAPVLPRGGVHGAPPQQGSSWTVPQTVAHVTSAVGGVLSGTVEGVLTEGSSWT